MLPIRAALVGAALIRLARGSSRPLFGFGDVGMLFAGVLIACSSSGLVMDTAWLWTSSASVAALHEILRSLALMVVPLHLFELWHARTYGDPPWAHLAPASFFKAPLVCLTWLFAELALAEGGWPPDVRSCAASLTSASNGSPQALLTA